MFSLQVSIMRSWQLGASVVLRIHAAPYLQNLPTMIRTTIKYDRIKASNQTAPIEASYPSLETPWRTFPSSRSYFASPSLNTQSSSCSSRCSFFPSGGGLYCLGLFTSALLRPLAVTVSRRHLSQRVSQCASSRPGPPLAHISTVPLSLIQHLHPRLTSLWTWARVPHLPWRS